MNLLAFSKTKKINILTCDWALENKVGYSSHEFLCICNRFLYKIDTKHFISNS